MIVTFTGDISVTGTFIQPIISNKEIFSDLMLSELKKSDFVICNFEGPATNHTAPINKNTPLKSPINSIKYLNERNVSIFNLANNHTLDYGETGLKHTLEEIKNEKCSSFGASLKKEELNTPLIIKKDGISIALFGITKCKPIAIKNAQLFSADDFSTLKKQVEGYKNNVDFIIINFHGGEEYSLYPSPVKRNFLKKIAALPMVDCVISHHSHTFQGYEKYKSTYIFYSLGNFIFDIPNHKPYQETNNGALLNLHFTKNNFSFSFLPFQINKAKITNTNQVLFKQKIAELSNFTNYKNKWQKEAFRILFRKENPNLKRTFKDKNSLQNKSFTTNLLSRDFYTKAIIILKDEYMFSLYLNAIMHRVKKKFTSWKLH